LHHFFSFFFDCAIKNQAYRTGAAANVPARAGFNNPFF